MCIELTKYAKSDMQPTRKTITNLFQLKHTTIQLFSYSFPITITVN